MIKNNLLYLFIIALIIFSCSKEREFSVPENNTNTEIVLKERDPNSPLILSKKKKNRIESKSAITFDKCLGMSFKCNLFPLGDMHDLGYSVIDIDRLKKDHPGYFSTIRIGRGAAESFSYASFNRYTTNSNTSKKVSMGASINLGLFSLGAKRSMTEVFSSSKIEEQNRVFGELNIEIRDSSYRLQTSSNINQKIMLDYLTDDFRDELYNTSPSELFYNYGGYVLSGFIVGGRATALYTGVSTDNQLTEAKESSMNTDISASYGFKENSGSSVSANLGFGKGYSNNASTSNKIKSMEVSIKTVGGSLENSRFSIPVSMDNLNLDMTDWVSSLSDKGTHSIVDITDNGLVPIVDFVIEKNLKQSLSLYYQSGVTEIKPLIEPYLKIITMEYTKIFAVYVGLYTRFNSYIEQILFTERINQEYSEEEKLNYIEQLKNKCQSISGMKITLTRTKLPISGSSSKIVLPFNEMKKYVYNNTIYILYTFESKKSGFSIHADYLLDTYAIRNFVNNLPTIEILPQNLLDYEIIAL